MKPIKTGLKKPNKRQRHAIYKRVAKQLEKVNWFLCLMCADEWQKTYGPLFFSEYKTSFPEIYAQKPRRAGDNAAYWSITPYGHRKRKEVIAKCIEMTAPQIQVSHGHRVRNSR